MSEPTDTTPEQTDPSHPLADVPPPPPYRPDLELITYIEEGYPPDGLETKGRR